MFPKNHRFNHHDFGVCYEKGKRYHTSGLTVIICSQSEYKVAVVVPKKHCPLAVNRNTTRRQLYHQLKPVIKGQNQQQGYIFLIKKDYIQATESQKQVMINEVITRILKTTVQ